MNLNFIIALDDYLEYLSASENLIQDKSTLQTD